MALVYNRCCFHQTGLKKLCWQLTLSCNLSCKHCLVVRDRGQRQVVSADPLEADLATLMVIHQWGTKHLILSGGEPTMYPHLVTLVRMAHSMGMTVGLSTNGTLMSSRLAERLAEAGLNKASVSIDGYDSRTHAASRGPSASFELALQGAERLSLAGVSVTLNCVLHASIIGNLMEFVKPTILSKAKVLSFTYPICRNASSTAALAAGLPPPEEIRKEAASLAKQARDVEVQMNVPSCDSRDCPAGHEIAGVDSHGRLVNCLVKSDRLCPSSAGRENSGQPSSTCSRRRRSSAASATAHRSN